MNETIDFGAERERRERLGRELEDVWELELTEEDRVSLFRGIRLLAANRQLPTPVSRLPQSLEKDELLIALSTVRFVALPSDVRRLLFASYVELANRQLKYDKGFPPYFFAGIRR